MMLRNKLVMGLAGVALPLVSTAWAQELPPEEELPSGEIVVTAQKRSERIDRVPITITAVSQETLDQQGIKNISDLARTTPGLTFRSGDGFDNPSLAIRGILTNVGAATTGVYIDETPISARSVCFFCGSTAFPQLFDLERVEVLKGPQGTLFGAGSMGGTVRFLTPQPSVTEFTGYGRAELATTRFADPSYEAGLAVGGPIVQDKVGFRVSGWHRKEGGYIDRIDRITGATLNKDVNDLSSYVGRAALTFKPDERLTITPSLFFQRNETNGRSLFKPALGRFKTDRTIEEPGSDRQLLGSLTANYEWDAVTLTSVTSYYDRKQGRQDDYSEIYPLIFSGGTVSFIPGFETRSEVTTTQKNWTQEVRLSSNGDGPFKWTAGLFYANNKNNLRQDIRQNLDTLTNALFGVPAVFIFGVDQTTPFSYQTNQFERERELAAFGQASYSITDKLTLSAGARISRAKFNSTIFRTGPEQGPTDLLVNTKIAETPISPKATLSYQSGPTLLYATAAKGYRIGGGNTSVRDVAACQQDLLDLGISDIPSNYKSDSVWSYELGAKSRFADGRGRISGAVFQVDWNNIQTSALLPICLFDYIANTGKARSRGFELQASLEPVDGLNFYGQLGYTDAKYLNTLFSGQARIVAAGQQLPVSKWVASAGAEYEFDLSSSTKAYLRGDYQYSSKIVRSVVGNSNFDAFTSRAPELHLASARVGVRIDDVDVSLFVNNLFDARTIVLNQKDLNSSDQLRNIVVRPRSIGATVTGRF